MLLESFPVVILLVLIGKVVWSRLQSGDPPPDLDSSDPPAPTDPPGLRITPVGDGMYLLERADGSRAMIDEATVEYLRSTAGDPDQAALDAVLARTARARVWAGGMHRGAPIGTDILLDVRDPAALAALHPALRIAAEPGGHCMCHGDPALELLDARDQRLAVLGVHHGVGIRWSAWKNDARLLDGAALLRWLAERGVPEPLAAYEQAKAEQEAARLAWNRWVEAVPMCLRKLPQDVQKAAFAASDPAPLRAALDAAHPSTGAAILELVRWYGCGSGPWSPCPVYESFAAVVLAAYDGDELRRVLLAADLDDLQLEGAARFLVHSGDPPSWPKSPLPDGMAVFSPAPKTPVPIPAPLLARLMTHLHREADPDKLERARVLTASPP